MTYMPHPLNRCIRNLALDTNQPVPARLSAVAAKSQWRPCGRTLRRSIVQLAHVSTSDATQEQVLRGLTPP